LDIKAKVQIVLPLLYSHVVGGGGEAIVLIWKITNSQVTLLTNAIITLITNAQVTLIILTSLPILTQATFSLSQGNISTSNSLNNETVKIRTKVGAAQTRASGQEFL
jgi:hypothetical protein